MNPLRVACPHCRATIGQQCMIPGTKHTMWSGHPSRHAAARASYEQHQ